jgi:hypothetical protein
VRSLDAVGVAFGAELCLLGRSFFFEAFSSLLSFFHLSIYSFKYLFWLLAFGVRVGVTYVYMYGTVRGSVASWLLGFLIFFYKKNLWGRVFGSQEL